MMSTPPEPWYKPRTNYFAARAIFAVCALFYLYHTWYLHARSGKVISAESANAALTSRLKKISTASNTTTTSRVQKSYGISLDIISVGTIHQKELQKAQKATFGSHPAVRHFYAATESDDAERDCHSNLTIDHVKQIVQFCKSTKNRKTFPLVLRRLTTHYATMRFVQGKKKPTGWFCAIKRPVDAFMNAARKYAYWGNDGNTTSNLPDFLFLGDDDSWINVDLMVPYIRENYNLGPRVLAGCMIVSRVHENNFTVGFGGFGFLLNKAALYNFLRPVHCRGTADQQHYDNYYSPYKKDEDFEEAACWRIAQNSIGEQSLFRDGMSVADLMKAYKDAADYLEVKNWDGVGFCLHGDWIWGYFLNFYPIAPPTYTRSMDEFVTKPWHIDMVHSRLEGYQGSYLYAGRATNKTRAKLGQCRHGEVNFDDPTQPALKTGDPNCSPNAHLCHKITPAHMYRLHSLIVWDQNSK